MEATYTDTAGGQTRFPQIVAGLKSPSDQNKEGSREISGPTTRNIYLNLSCNLLVVIYCNKCIAEHIFLRDREQEKMLMGLMRALAL